MDGDGQAVALSPEEVARQAELAARNRAWAAEQQARAAAPTGVLRLRRYSDWILSWLLRVHCSRDPHCTLFFAGHPGGGVQSSQILGGMWSPAHPVATAAHEARGPQMVRHHRRRQPNILRCACVADGNVLSCRVRLGQARTRRIHQTGKRRRHARCTHSKFCVTNRWRGGRIIGRAIRLLFTQAPA